MVCELVFHDQHLDLAVDVKESHAIEHIIIAEAVYDLSVFVDNQCGRVGVARLTAIGRNEELYFIVGVDEVFSGGGNRRQRITLRQVDVDGLVQGVIGLVHVDLMFGRDETIVANGLDDVFESDYIIGRGGCEGVVQ